MKNLFLSLVLFVSFTAYGSGHETILKQCTTVGDALSEVQILVDQKGNQFLNVVEMDQSSKRFQMITDYESKAKTNKTYIASKDVDATYGGSVADSVMMEMNVDKRTATLAYQGAIYFLVCK